MARVNGVKRKVNKLTEKIEIFKGFRNQKMNPEQHAVNENNIKILEKELAELKH